MRRVQIGAITLLGFLAALPACDDPVPAPEPAEAPKPPPKALPTVLRGSMHGVGPITSKVEPTVEAIDAVLDDRYTVRASEGGPEGSTVQVLFEGKVVLDVFGDPESKKILRTVSTDGHVVFPWNTKVGNRIGDHQNWERMTCRLADKPFEGKAQCHAFEVGRVSYLVEGWTGEAGVLPAKELMADAKIAGVMWTPTYEEPKAP
jgi:hypothetical protein